jgi:hypothetical protein
MNHRHLLHAGCLLAASLIFSGCVAGQQAQPAKQTKAPAAEKVVITPDEEVVIRPSENQAPAKPKAAPKPVAKPAPAPAPAAAEPAVAKPAPAAPATDSPLEHYNVKVTSNKTALAVGESMSFHVIVEAPNYPISGNTAHGVQVSFSGLDFAAEAPAVECLRAHPSGSEIIYIVTATKAGSFDVAANVSVFPTRECSTFNVQKSSAPVNITVK